MRRAWKVLARSEGGAVAPTVALSFFGLMAIGGVAFDYARLAGMDTELQNAADQAALAAATQLDGSADSITRANAAANGLIANDTRFANDGAGPAVTVASTTFYVSYDQASDSYGAVTTDPTKAKVVQLVVSGRTANYALTPITRIFSTGPVQAEAVAGLSSAICREPPLMMCNPNEGAPGTWDVSSYVGRGMVLKANGGAAYAPGDFGFLDVGAGASDMSKLMGYDSSLYECAEVTQPRTQPGSMTGVMNEFNTRFDIFEGGDSINCYSGSLCPPSANSRKDVVHTLSTGGPFAKKDCGFATGGNDGWKISDSPYRPDTIGALASTVTPDVMGYPRDLCHANGEPAAVASGSGLAGDCGTANWRIGDGSWDINAYWRSNHGGVDYSIPVGSGLSASPTRYQVYKWEMANAATQLAPKAVTGLGSTYGEPVCRPGVSGSTPGPSTPDRRIVPIAVVNCTGLSGSKPVTPLDWVDVFLVEPSIARGKGAKAYTRVGDIYVEIVGRTSTGTGGTTSQVVRRDKPYLIR